MPNDSGQPLGLLTRSKTTTQAQHLKRIARKAADQVDLNSIRRATENSLKSSVSHVRCTCYERQTLELAALDRVRPHPDSSAGICVWVSAYPRHFLAKLSALRSGRMAPG